MGYITFVNGNLVLRPDKVKEDAELFVNEKGKDWIDRDWESETEFTIHLTEIKMYSGYARDFFLGVAEFFNGTINCEGEENGDVYDLVFNEGKISLVRYELRPLKPQEDLDKIFGELGWDKKIDGGN